MRSALQRKNGHGFLSLIPAPEPSTPDPFLDAIAKLAADARIEALDARRLALDAVWFDHHGHVDRAATERSRSEVAHRAACAHLAALSGKVRALVMWACLDWRPSVDVAGSGLTRAELAVLCGVTGEGTPEEEVSNDEAGK